MLKYSFVSFECRNLGMSRHQNVVVTRCLCGWTLSIELITIGDVL